MFHCPTITASVLFIDVFFTQGLALVSWWVDGRWENWVGSAQAFRIINPDTSRSALQNRLGSKAAYIFNDTFKQHNKLWCNSCGGTIALLVTLLSSSGLKDHVALGIEM